MLGQFPSLQQVVFANAALSTGIGYYHFPATVLSAATGQPHGQNLLQKVPGLSDAATNYLQVMRGITQDFHHPNIRKSLLAALRQVHPAIESVELDSLVNPQRAIIGHKAADRTFELILNRSRTACAASTPICWPCTRHPPSCSSSSRSRKTPSSQAPCPCWRRIQGGAPRAPRPGDYHYPQSHSPGLL